MDWLGEGKERTKNVWFWVTWSLVYIGLGGWAVYQALSK